MISIKNNLLFFSVFNFSFENLVSYASVFSLKLHRLKCVILFTFSLYFFLLNLFSFFVSSLYFYSPCRYSSYSLFLHVFFFSLSMFPFLTPALLVFIYLQFALIPFFLRDLSCWIAFISRFFGKNTFLQLLIKKKNFRSISFFVSSLYSYCRIASFFNRVLSKKINWLFSENHFFNPPRT